MAWDDAPPAPEELTAAPTAGWDSSPPTEQELGEEPSRYSLPTSLQDAAHRIGQGGLFLTPHEETPAGQPVSANEPPREGPMPSPMGLGAAAAGAASSIGGASGPLANIARGVGKDVLGKAGSFAPNTLGAIKTAAAPFMQAGGALVSGAAQVTAQLGTAAGQALESSYNAVAAAYQKSERNGAVAHYLATQRDPAYAAAQQDKGKK